jgi:hypothetical protein
MKTLFILITLVLPLKHTLACSNAILHPPVAQAPTFQSTGAGNTAFAGSAMAAAGATRGLKGNSDTSFFDESFWGSNSAPKNTPSQPNKNRQISNY